MPPSRVRKKITEVAAQTTQLPEVPVAPTPAVQSEPTTNGAPQHIQLSIVYDKLTIHQRDTTTEAGPLTVEEVKMLLEWETEPQFQERMVREQGGVPADWLFDKPFTKPNGEVVVGFHCLNINKEKVRCWNNAGNRPFDDEWCQELRFTILNGQWAGPFTITGETINCEIIRISKYGRVISGQHQGTALILADEYLEWSKTLPDYTTKPQYPAWNGHEHPFLETLVATGMSEDPRVLQTVDYVKPRTVADMLYTMDLYRDNTPKDRQELTRMTAAAIDFLWARTDTKGYKTHPEVVGFLERHKRLLKCVEHLFKENRAILPAEAATPAWPGQVTSGRKISKLKLSAGQSAAICYLMASSGPETDGDVYRNESPPCEKRLDWSLWNAACEFWSKLAGDRGFTQVRIALNSLVDSAVNNEENQGLGGRADEKLALVAKAWDKWKEDRRAFSDADLAAPDGALCLSYSDLDSKGNKLPEGQIKLLDIADFGGIDCTETTGRGGRGERTSAAVAAAPMAPAPSREEIEAATQAARERRATAGAR